MLTSDRPGVDESARGLLAEVSLLRGWPADNPVNNYQDWREPGDSVTEIPLMDSSRGGVVTLGGYPRGLHGSYELVVL
jgi:hypothetical protein